MPGAGVEPARPNGHMALNHACLPVPAPGLKTSLEKVNFQGLLQEIEFYELRILNLKKYDLAGAFRYFAIA